MASAVSASFKRIGAALFFCGAILFLVQVAGHNSTDHISTKPSLPSTLPKVELAEPTLSDAKEAIPSALKTIYESLNQGNPAQAAQNLSPQILQRAALLDLICRPFTYRAHYVEAIIARPFPANGRAAPGQQFQVRVRSLLTPLEERAQTMMFRITQGRCVLEEVSETGDDWFGPQKEEAKEIVRRFIYAAKAGRQYVPGRNRIAQPRVLQARHRRGRTAPEAPQLDSRGPNRQSLNHAVPRSQDFYRN